MKTIPQERVQLVLPEIHLRNLPLGAVYEKKRGRAGIKIRVHQDTVYISATCDSLQRLCNYYEERSYYWKHVYEQTKNEIITQREQRNNPIRTTLTAFLIGFVAGIILTFIKRF